MSFENVKLIFLRELRDQLRDRRTLFAVVVLPLLLYPLLGMLIFQVQQFLKEHTSKIRIVTADDLPPQPRLLDGGKLAAEFGDPRHIEIEIVPSSKSFDDIRSQSQADIALGLCDAVVYFPPDFAQQLARIRAGNDKREDKPENASPETQIIFDAARDKSRVAQQRIESILLHWRNSLGESNLEASNVSAIAARPFNLKQTDVAPAVRRRVALWSKI